MSNENRVDRPRFTWCFAEQRGLCYLGTHHRCAARGRRMVIGKPTLGYRWKHAEADPFAGGFATWEHVLPRALRSAGAASLKMLACYDCNASKGDAAPTPAQVLLALDHGRAWFAIDEERSPRERALATSQIEADAKRFLRRVVRQQEADDGARVVALMHKARGR